MMMKTIKCPKTGNMACVAVGEKHAHHKNWIVLGEHKGRPPEHAHWVDGQGWVVDEEKAASELEKATINAMTNVELMESFREMIYDLQNQIAQLKKK